MGTLRTRKQHVGYAESSANWGALLTRVFSFRVLFGEPQLPDFGILSERLVYATAAFAGLNSYRLKAGRIDYD